MHNYYMYIVLIKLRASREMCTTCTSHYNSFRLQSWKVYWLLYYLARLGRKLINKYPHPQAIFLVVKINVKLKEQIGSWLPPGATSSLFKDAMASTVHRYTCTLCIILLHSLILLPSLDHTQRSSYSIVHHTLETANFEHKYMHTESTNNEPKHWSWWIQSQSLLQLILFVQIPSQGTPDLCLDRSQTLSAFHPPLVSPLGTQVATGNDGRRG
jgi:hypothetical protein